MPSSERESSTIADLLQAQLDQAQMMVMTDLEEPFVPFREGLFVDPYESQLVSTLAVVDDSKRRLTTILLET